MHACFFEATHALTPFAADRYRSPKESNYSTPKASLQ